MQERRAVLEDCWKGDALSRVLPSRWGRRSAAPDLTAPREDRPEGATREEVEVLVKAKLRARPGN